MNKYHNLKTYTEEGKFDSRYELKVWNELKLLEQAHVISDLQRQVPFELIPTIKTNAGTLSKISYVADFVYKEGNQWYALDSKGFETKEFKLKKRLFILKYGDVYKFIERKRGKADKIY